MSFANEIYVFCLFGFVEIDKLVSWVEDEYSKEVQHSNLDFLLNGSKSDKQKYFIEIFEDQYKDFKIDSDEGVKACKKLMVYVCEKYLAKQLSPGEFCKFVCELEAYYTDNSQTGSTYPEFIGELWDYCDWCDHQVLWTHENSPHLKEEALKVIELCKS